MWHKLTFFLYFTGKFSLSLSLALSLSLSLFYFIFKL